MRDNLPGPGGFSIKPVRNGLGIVAARAHAKGEMLFEVDGAVVSPSILADYWRSNPQRAVNCFRYDEDLYIDPQGRIGQYANHSCNPNAGVVKLGQRLIMVAIKPIAQETEVTHDYTTLLGADDVWTMHCNCGAWNCRRIVRSITSLPRVTSARYRRLGIIPGYILKTAPRLFPEANRI